MYNASITLWIAGLKPALSDAIIPKSVNAIAVEDRPMNIHMVLSTKSEAHARLRSNKGEWISFFTVLGACAKEPEGAWELEALALPSRRGVLSLGVLGTSSSRMIGSGLSDLMATRYKHVKHQVMQYARS